MKRPTVRLLVRVRHTDGTYGYRNPVLNRNATLRAQYALVQGKPVHHPEACYYIRYNNGRKNVREAVGR